MKKANTPEHFSFSGRVIEIFQKGSHPIIRVAVDTFYLDLPSLYLQEAHLKDAVLIEGNLSVDSVQNDFNATAVSAKSKEI